MSTTVKTAAKGATKTKNKKTDDKPSVISPSSTSHQQHHSAPPAQNPQSKAGLQSIHEHLEYLPPDGSHESRTQPAGNVRFPRSSTVPYPAYATVRAGDPHRPPVQYYYSDYPAFLHGTLSPAQANTYFNSRQPFAAINTNFQPISPHHQQYSSRPVDILKPTFLIVPKEAEQQLSSQLSASNSPVPVATKAMPKKQEKKNAKKTTTTVERTSPSVRSVEVQTSHPSPPRPMSAVELGHGGMLATANPSPYVHFLHLPYSTQSPSMFHDGPPETSIIHEEFIHVNDYQPGNASIRSMPNIALAQGKKKKKEQSERERERKAPPSYYPRLHHRQGPVLACQSFAECSVIPISVPVP